MGKNGRNERERTREMKEGKRQTGQGEQETIKLEAANMERK